jgi:hypothetical protein
VQQKGIAVCVFYELSCFAMEGNANELDLALLYDCL